MGMYDELSRSLTDRIISKCPKCGKEMVDTGENYISEWQTKSFDCLLKILSLSDIDRDKFEMHHICPHCNKYISVCVDLDKGTYILQDNDGEYTIVNDFADKSLADEYKRDTKSGDPLDSFHRRYLRNKSIGYTELGQYIYREFGDTEFEVGSLVHSIIEDFYVIPKEDLEDFT